MFSVSAGYIRCWYEEGFSDKENIGIFLSDTVKRKGYVRYDDSISMERHEFDILELTNEYIIIRLCYIQRNVFDDDSPFNTDFFNQAYQTYQIYFDKNMSVTLDGLEYYITSASPKKRKFYCDKENFKKYLEGV